MLRVPSEINKSEFELLKMQDATFVAYRSDIYPAKNDVFFEENAVIYVLEGDKKFNNTHHEVHVKKGDILFVRRGFYLMSESINASYKSLVFFFDEKLLKEFVAINESIFENTVPQSSQVDALITFKTSDKFEQFIKTVLPYFEKKNSQYLNEFLRLKYQELLLHLITFDTADQLKKMLKLISEGQKADLRYLMNNYYLKPLTLNEIARLSGRSLSSFKRAFQEEFEASPAAWIKQKRLEHAVFLLKNTTQNISEISMEIGYESISHFIKAFKEKFGVTPKQLAMNKN
jgi:AraC-like DNA-binding protein